MGGATGIRTHVNLIFAAGKMATKPGRKRKVITLESKIKIIEELKKGKSQRLVSNIFEVPKSTVADNGSYERKYSFMFLLVIIHPLQRNAAL